MEIVLSGFKSRGIETEQPKLKP